ncbi:MAG: hypothetical protein QOI81_1290 [Actinomycetota bacterium]|jgi:hypothetical protein|nr:hypothetical protein [Actinomycetota bacterium]
MERRFIASGTVVMMAATALLALGSAHASPKTKAAPVYEPVLDPANFVSVIDNPYYPLPVGRTLIYTGIKDGQTQRETVNVTSDTRVIEGITATALSDISKHKGTLLEKTTDWYAQDKQGNVWYMGEDTKAYSPNGNVDTSGSWVAGVNDGEPGIIMEANPQVPDAYRQELLPGEAADTAWIVDRGGSITVPYGTVHQVLTSLEATQVEPGSYDQKIYAPGLGIVREQALTDVETSRLVKVIN